jgi:hypothetical protein
MEDLAPEENPRFQRREWWFQRVTWALLAVFIGAAVLGAFGSGPLSEAEVENGRLKVAYSRFARRGAINSLRLYYQQPAGERSVWVELSGGCFGGGTVEEIHPRPHRSLSRHGDGTSLELELSPGEEWAQLELRIRPEKMGRHRCQIAPREGAALALQQWIYP